MPVIDNPDRAMQLAGAIATDLRLYNADRIRASSRDPREEIAGEIAEGRELFDARVSPEIVASGIFDEAIEAVLLPGLAKSDDVQRAEKLKEILSSDDDDNKEPASEDIQKLFLPAEPDAAAQGGSATPRSTNASQGSSKGLVAAIIVLALLAALFFALKSTLFGGERPPDVQDQPEGQPGQHGVQPERPEAE